MTRRSGVRSGAHVGRSGAQVAPTGARARRQRNNKRVPIKRPPSRLGDRRYVDSADQSSIGAVQCAARLTHRPSQNVA